MEHLAHKAVWWPCRVRIGGTRLGPVTLGQLRILEAVSSPYLMGGPVTLADAGIARLILRLPWRTMRRAMRHPRLAAALSTLSALRCTDATVRSLGEWLAGELWRPDKFMVAGESASGFSSATGLAHRLAIICHREGAAITPFRRRSAWDFTAREALLLAVTLDEMRGAEYITREDLDDPPPAPTANCPLPTAN